MDRGVRGVAKSQTQLSDCAQHSTTAWGLFLSLCPVTARLNRHEYEQTPGDARQRSLACCRPWGPRESDRAERLKNNSSSCRTWSQWPFPAPQVPTADKDAWSPPFREAPSSPGLPGCRISLSSLLLSLFISLILDHTSVTPRLIGIRHQFHSPIPKLFLAQIYVLKSNCIFSVFVLF